MPKEYNDDDRVPKHPKATDDYIKVQKWEEEFMDFLLSKGAARTKARLYILLLTS